MRFLALVSTALAATAFAAENESSASESESPSSVAESPKAATPEPTPIGEIWKPKWKDSDLASYKKRCESSVTFSAQIYKLGEMYPTLKEFAPELKVFYHKQHYPGSWEGKDLHGNDRELLKMDYESLPFGVREWLQKNKKQRHFSVQEGVVFFAPGAIYPRLPLWVDEPEEEYKGECDGKLRCIKFEIHPANMRTGVEDLELYSTEAKDGAILGKVSHKKKGKNEIEITVEAFQVKKKAVESQKDEL